MGMTYEDVVAVFDKSTLQTEVAACGLTAIVPETISDAGVEFTRMKHVLVGGFQGMSFVMTPAGEALVDEVLKSAAKALKAKKAKAAEDEVSL